MPILLDGKEYRINQKLIKDCFELAVEEYGKLDINLKLVGKTVARAILTKMEDGVRKKTGDEEKALFFRPNKKEDAVLFLLSRLFGVIGTAINNANITLLTTDGEITCAAIENPSGRSLASDGDERIRQDDSSEVS